MLSIQELSTYELELFREKMILVYDNNEATVKVEASIVLSMIDEELLDRGIDVSEEFTDIEQMRTFSKIIVE